MCISGVCLSCLYDITEWQLHHNNARGINIQLRAHQLHINNYWGVNCVIIPAPMVFGRKKFLMLGLTMCVLVSGSLIARGPGNLLDPCQELFERSDVVAVNLALNEQTKGFVTRSLMEKLKPEAVVSFRIREVCLP